MSKKKPASKKLLKGKFYAVHEGSKHGHPGKLYWKNDQKNIYLFLKTGTTPTPDNIVLTVPTEKGVKRSSSTRNQSWPKERTSEASFPICGLGKPISLFCVRLAKEISQKPHLWAEKIVAM